MENRIDLEAKIDEKTKAMQNLQNSNENTVEELKNKIIELNTIIEINKQQEKEGKKEANLCACVPFLPLLPSS